MCLSGILPSFRSSNRTCCSRFFSVFGIVSCLLRDDIVIGLLCLYSFCVVFEVCIRDVLIIDDCMRNLLEWGVDAGHVMCI